jgi:hypothetical protein
MITVTEPRFTVAVGMSVASKFGASMLHINSLTWIVGVDDLECNDISYSLGLLKRAGRTQIKEITYPSALVMRVSSYFGRANPNVWESLKSMSGWELEK